MSGAARPLVSVITPARNSAGSIGTLLDALEAQTLPRERWELVVVDDASDDDTAAVVERRGWPRVVRNATKLGSGPSRNVGVAHARGELLAFTDSDCIPDPGWLAAGVERFERDSGLAGLAGPITVTLGERPTIAALLDAAMFLAQADNVRNGGFAVTANVWYRHAVFERHGGFNERLRWSHSDREFGVLVTRSGDRLEFAEELHVSHPPRSDPRELARKAYRVGRGHAALRRYARVPEPGHRFVTSPRYYAPRVALRKYKRLRERGVAVTPWLRVRMLLVELPFLSWPWVWGDVVGTTRMALGRED